MHWHLKKGNNIIIKRKRTSADLNNNQFTFKEATDYAKNIHRYICTIQFIFKH